MNGRRRADVLEDVLWLAGSGVAAEQWPERLGMKPDAVARALYRAGRRDLANPVQAMARREYVNQPRDEPCPQCGGVVLKYRTYCSRRCAGYAINRRIRGEFEEAAA